MGTFMFDGDRFSEAADYAATYRALGGSALKDAQVNALIAEVFRRMEEDYGNPSLYECFPSVSHYLESTISKSNLLSREIELLDRVFAIYETGTIRDTYAEALRQLHRTHRLAVVSNIWCKGDLCLSEFRRAGVADLFEAVIFSSDHGINKPSPLLYLKPLEELGVERSKVVFVGDSLRYDIAGANATGMAAIWICADESHDGQDVEGPDLVISDLRDLLEA
jgi:HAD superfamily hydrolase (TIGR01549 family)